MYPPNPLDAKPSASKAKELKEKIREEKTRIKEAISDAIEGLPLPLFPITEEEAKEDFENLVKFETRPLLRKMIFILKPNINTKLQIGI